MTSAPEHELYLAAWTPPPEFPAYLRACRAGAHLTLRAAAAMTEFSFAVLGRLELGQYPKRPPVRLLSRLAAVYGVDATEMLVRAGVVPSRQQIEAEPDDTEARFRAVLLDPLLRPEWIDEAALSYFSARHQRTVLSLLDALAAQDDPAACLRRIAPRRSAAP